MIENNSISFDAPDANHPYHYQISTAFIPASKQINDVYCSCRNKKAVKELFENQRPYAKVDKVVYIGMAWEGERLPS